MCLTSYVSSLKIDVLQLQIKNILYMYSFYKPRLPGKVSRHIFKHFKNILHNGMIFVLCFFPVKKTFIELADCNRFLPVRTTRMRERAVSLQCRLCAFIQGQYHEKHRPFFQCGAVRDSSVTRECHLVLDI